MTKIIDGKVLAKKHQQLLKKRLDRLAQKPRVVSILVGDDVASKLYVNLKQKKATELGIDLAIKHFPKNAKFVEIAELIANLNQDGSIDGVMVQLPLPPSLQQYTHQLIDLIDSRKDIDGLTGKGPYLPAHTKAVIAILKTVEDLDGQVAAVVGSEGWTGQSIVQAMQFRFPHLIKVDQKLTSTSLNDLKEANVIISCTGVVNLIKPEHLQKGVILIDVGLGDFDPSCFKKASFYTPKIGGVGPMTIISLMENATGALERRRDLKRSEGSKKIV